MTPTIIPFYIITYPFRWPFTFAYAPTTTHAHHVLTDISVYALQLLSIPTAAPLITYWFRFHGNESFAYSVLPLNTWPQQQHRQRQRRITLELSGAITSIIISRKYASLCIRKTLESIETIHMLLIDA